MIEIKLSRFVLCSYKQGSWAYFNMFSINTSDINLVPKQRRSGFQKLLTPRESLNILMRPFREMSTFLINKEVIFPTANVVMTTYIFYQREN